MKGLVLIIRVQKGEPRMNVSLANQSRGPKGWSAVQGNISGNFVDADKHYRNIGQKKVLKYLRKKLLAPH